MQLFNLGYSSKMANYDWANYRRKLHDGLFAQSLSVGTVADMNRRVARFYQLWYPLSQNCGTAVRHHARRHGQRYGLWRTFRVLMDLLTISVYEDFLTRPWMHVFGLFGLISMVFRNRNRPLFNSFLKTRFNRWQSPFANFGGSPLGNRSAAV